MGHLDFLHHCNIIAINIFNDIFLLKFSLLQCHKNSGKLF